MKTPYVVGLLLAGVLVSAYSCQDEFDVDLGTGNLSVTLPDGASFAVDVSVGIGNLTINGFSDMELDRTGFMGQNARGRIGSGQGRLNLDVGVGNLVVKPAPAD